MAEEPAQPLVLPPNLSVVAQSQNQAQLDRWALALLALNIPHQMMPSPLGGGLLLVRTLDAPRAEDTLHAVEAEETARVTALLQQRPPEKLPAWALWYTQFLALVLVVFSYFAGGRGGVSTVMMDRGRMDASLVLQGAWERLFTGVTLHADGAHLMSNLVFLMVVAPTVVMRLGPGVTSLALLLTGAAGNVVSAGYHGAHFGNVGASGGLFGLLCILAILSSRTRQNRLGGNRWILGVGAGLALLSMTGFGDESDVAAHVAGFASAVPLGLWMPIKPRENVPAWWWAVQVVTFSVAAALLSAAWWTALH